MEEGNDKQAAKRLRTRVKAEVEKFEKYCWSVEDGKVQLNLTTLEKRLSSIGVLVTKE